MSVLLNEIWGMACLFWSRDCKLPHGPLRPWRSEGQAHKWWPWKGYKNVQNTEGRQFGPPLPKAKPLVAVEYHVYIIYIYITIIIYIYYLCRSVFFFFSGLHQWASMMLTSEWNCSCRTICNRIKLCSSEEFPFESYEGHVPLLRLRDNGENGWFHDQSHEKYHYHIPLYWLVNYGCPYCILLCGLSNKHQ